MADRNTMRASDADRDRIADRLRHAAAEGRLQAHELEERLARALRARTYGELDRVVADLPGQHAPTRREHRLPVHPALAVIALPFVLPVALCLFALAIGTVVMVACGFVSLWFVWAIIAVVMFSRHRHGHTHHRGPWGRGPAGPWNRGPGGPWGRGSRS